MQKWVELMDAVENENSAIKKKEMLELGISIYPELEEFLRLTFKANIVLNIDSKSLENSLGINTKLQFKDIGEKIKWFLTSQASNKSLFDLDNRQSKTFDEFVKLHKDLQNIRGMSSKALLNDFFLNCDKDDAKWYSRCLVKDLSSKTSIMTINKVLIKCGKRPISKFSLQLAVALGNNNIEEKLTTILQENNNELYCETKFDGTRLTITNLNGKWEALSRNGKPILNVDNLLYEAQRIFGDTPVELDGELIADNFYDLMTTIHRKNDTATIIPRTYQIFDVMTYKDNIEDMLYKDRRQILETIIPKDSLVFSITQTITLYHPKDIIDFFNQEVEKGEEGIIVKTNAPYTRKREHWYKLKPKNNLDLRIIGFDYAKNGKYVGKRNVIIVSDLNGNLISKVGSGLKENDIELFSMGEENDWIGKIVEIDFDSITPTNKDGIKSLRFPRFVKLREDKDIADEVDK
ncbi:MAG: hypothetical protein EOL97_10055 [Spirochaetia bacterium]|nr:hypothetical protein [Spirochaetia bacterium]